MSLRLGVVTIGQTPRVDLTPELQLLLPGVELVERGVLDGLDAEQVAGLAPVGGEHVLTTRMADGSAAVIGESAVLDRLSVLLEALEQQVDAVLLACTGPFPRLAHRKPLVVPDRVITHGVVAVTEPDAVVGVLTPLPEQLGDSHAKFSAVHPGRVVVAASSPYTGDEADLRRAGAELRTAGATVIALDCFGYTAAMRDVVAQQAGVPVVVARSVAARLAAELLGAGLPGSPA